MIAIPMPLVSISFIGNFSVNTIGLYRNIIAGGSQDPDSTPIIGLGGNLGVSSAILLPLILQPVVVVISLISLKVDRRAEKLAMVAGVLGLISGVSWVILIEALRDSIALLVIPLAGPLAGMIPSTVKAELGPYVNLIGSFIILSSYFAAPSKKREELAPQQEQAEAATQTTS